MYLSKKYKNTNKNFLVSSLVLFLIQILLISYYRNLWLAISFTINLSVLLGLYINHLRLIIKEQNSYLNIRKQTREDFGKKKGRKLLKNELENLFSPNFHSRDRRVYIASLIQERIGELETSRKDYPKIGLWALIFTFCQIVAFRFVYGFSLVINTLSPLGVLGGILGGFVVTAFTGMGYFLFSRMSPIEKEYKDLLAKYQTSLKEENLEEN